MNTHTPNDNDYTDYSTSIQQYITLVLKSHVAVCLCCNIITELQNRRNQHFLIYLHDHLCQCVTKYKTDLCLECYHCIRK